MTTFENDLKKLILEFKGLKLEYESMGTCDKNDEASKAFFKGKGESYGYAVKKLNDLLQWHDKGKV